MGLDYVAMIADLEEKKAAIEASIVSLRRAAGSDVGRAGGDSAFQSATANDRPVELPVGAFMGMSVPSAIKLYLSSMRRKQTIKEITAALKNGGMETTSDSFENVVTGSLNRLKATNPPEVLRFPDGWGLAELYPESFRSRLAQTQKPQKAKKKKKASGAKKQVAETAPVGPEKIVKNPQILVQKFFEQNIGDFSTQDVAKDLGITAQTVGLLASKLVKSGILEKTATGKYRSAKLQQMPKAG